MGEELLIYDLGLIERLELVPGFNYYLWKSIDFGINCFTVL
jgi:hypothetical protein